MSRLPECLRLMARDGVDALVLGREANARIVADTTRLWLAGTRPFAPGCVVVRTTGAVHVLANTDDAVPGGFPKECLFGITWNADKLVAALAAMPGLSGARRVAVDGMTPAIAGLLARVTPAAQLVDANALLSELWREPDATALARVTAAADVAAAGLAAMVAELRPGVHPRVLRGACAAAFAAAGVTTPAFEAVATPLDPHSSTWLPPDRPLAAGETVVLRAGALREGWEASLARTYVVGASAEVVAPPEGWDALLGACVAGATVGGLRGRDAVVYGIGRGVEPWDDEFVLAPGLLCALEHFDETSLRQDVLCVTEQSPTVITRGE
ncbi:MAG TPA: M24 family metallopeptidase [Acidimicrobiia bacterium]|nr:M24 family metallopeptidase [Acidimicrobiia bacterium]